MKMITFFLGFMIGGAVGTFAMALVKVGSRYDDDEDYSV